MISSPVTRASPVNPRGLLEDRNNFKIDFGFDACCDAQTVFLGILRPNRRSPVSGPPEALA